MAEKIQTEDVKYCHDDKILSRNSHSNLSIATDEAYNSVLSKVDTRSPTVNEKAALQASLTPSGSNRFITYDDVPNVISALDTGEMKDSVDDFSDLPLQLTNTSLVRASEIVTATTTSNHNYQIGQTAHIQGVIPISFNGSFIIQSTPALNQYTYKQAGADEASTVHGEGINKDKDLRPVLNDNIIYKWKESTSTWDAFIKTGVLDHPSLTNQNGDADYQHLTLTEKTNLISDEHTHSNKTTLDSITDAGSGAIITTVERGRLPTQDEKDAMLGTNGTPSNTNRYVTNSDPRLLFKTLPFMSIGNLGSGADFETVDETGFITAFAAIAATGGTLVVLTGTYNFANPVTWASALPLMIKNEPQDSAQINVNFAGSAFILGSSLCYVDGIRFNLNDVSAVGITSTASRLFVYNLNSLGTGLRIVTASGSNALISGCRFAAVCSDGQVVINGDWNTVKDCTFYNTGGNSVRLQTGSNNLIQGNKLKLGTLLIDAAVSKTIISHNFFETGVTISDSSTTSITILNQPFLINNPFVPFAVSVGQPGSKADFEGTDETPFNNALSYLGVSGGIIYVLTGTYSITSPIVIDKNIHILSETGAVLSSGTSKLFQVDATADLICEDLAFTSSGTNEILDTYTGCSFKFIRCSFTTSGARVINMVNENSYGLFYNCKFLGNYGIKYYGYFGNFSYCIFSLTNPANMALEITGQDGTVSDNIFSVGKFVCGASQTVVKGNHFGANVISNSGSNNIFHANIPITMNNDGENIIHLTMLNSPLQYIGGSGMDDINVGNVTAFGDSADSKVVTSFVQIPANRVIDTSKVYTISLVWSSSATIGDIYVKASVTFLDETGNKLGDVVSDYFTLTRSGLNARRPQTDSLSFGNYGTVTTPSVVAISIERLATHINDTMLATAYVFAAHANLPTVI